MNVCNLIIVILNRFNVNILNEIIISEGFNNLLTIVYFISFTQQFVTLTILQYV